MSWYMKGQSNYDNPTGFHMGFYMNMNGFASGVYDNQKMPNDVDQGDPFMSFAVKTKNWVPASQQVEIGLWDHNRIRVDASGVWGWHEVSGLWFSLYNGGESSLDLNGLTDVNITSVTQGDILHRGTSVWENLALGTETYVLKAGNSDVVWGQVAYSELTGVPSEFTPEAHVLGTSGPHTGSLPLTDLGSYAHGSIIKGGSSDWEALAKGTDGYFLKAGASDISWAQLQESDISDLNHNDTNAIHDNIANEITSITPKTTPVSNDEFVIEDSGASYVKKAVTFGNLESTIAHSNINDDEATKHRLINDSGTSTTELWSSNKINSELGNKANTNHDFDTHSGDLDLADIGGYSAGRLIYGGVSDWDYLTPGTENYVLKMGATYPAWGQVAYSELTGKPSIPSDYDYRFESRNTPSIPEYKYLCTLPVSGSGTYDMVYVEILGQDWTSDPVKQVYMFRNRSGFSYEWYYIGDAWNSSRPLIVVYDVSGRKNIYIKNNESYVVFQVRVIIRGGNQSQDDSYNVNGILGTDDLTAGWSTSTPSGSLVFDASNTSTYPPNAPFYVGLVDGKDVSGLCTEAEAHAYVEANALTLEKDLDLGDNDIENVGTVYHDDTSRYLARISSDGTDGGTLYKIGLYYDASQYYLRVKGYTKLMLDLQDVNYINLYNNEVIFAKQLDCGGNAITNVGNVDGVDISSFKSDFDSHDGGVIEDYHDLSTLQFNDIPNMSKYTDSEAILAVSAALGGDISGSVENMVVANDSHTHDTRYYTETEIDTNIYTKTEVNNIIDRFDEQSSTFPTTPSEGDFHYDEDDDSLYRYNGEAEAWIEVGVMGAVASETDNLGNHTATQNLNMNTHKITNVVDPTSNQEAATKKYVDDEINDKSTFFKESDDLIHSNDTERSKTSISYVKVKEIVSHIKGNIRVYWEHKAEADATSAQTVVYKNGVLIGTQFSASSSYTSETEDISVEPDDLIQIYGRAFHSFDPVIADTIYVRYMRIKYAKFSNTSGY